MDTMLADFGHSPFQWLVESSATPTILLFQYLITRSPTWRTHHVNIRWIIGYYDYPGIPILDAMLPEFKRSPFQYWLNHRPLRPYCYSNIWSLVRLLEALTMSILIEPSATPMVFIFQYSITCSPAWCTHHVNINWIIGYSYYSWIPILDAMLAEFRHSPFQYWLNPQPLRWYLHSNVHSLVCLLDALTMSIFVESSVTPIIPGCQYWMVCMLADLRLSPFQYWLNRRPLRWYLHSNIHSIVCLLDALTMSIFVESSVTPIIPGFQYWMLCMLADFRHSPFQYWLNRRPLRRYLHSNIQSLVCPLDALTMSIFVESSVTSIIPGFQYWLCMLADFRHSPFQYWLNRRRLRPYLYSNIWWLVRLLGALTMSIFLSLSTIPI